MITKEYSNLDKLIDLACNSFEMLDFLRINRPDEIYLVDRKEITDLENLRKLLQWNESLNV